MSEWMPIETAPKDGTPFIGSANDLRSGEQWAVIAFFDAEDDEFYSGDGEKAIKDLYSGITHWMPLPEPPTD